MKLELLTAESNLIIPTAELCGIKTPVNSFRPRISDSMDALSLWNMVLLPGIIWFQGKILFLK